MPNCINTTEVDIKKAYRKGGSSLGSGSGSTRIHQNYSVEQLTRHVSLRGTFSTSVCPLSMKLLSLPSQVQMLKLKLERRTIKISKVAES
jgi:regulator of G-protein signaling